MSRWRCCQPLSSNFELRLIDIWRFVRRPDERLEEDEQLMAQLSEGHPKLERTIQLARDFADIIRQRQVEKLDTWLEQAAESGYQSWRNFADGLIQDYDAVRAAL